MKTGQTLTHPISSMLGRLYDYFVLYAGLIWLGFLSLCWTLVASLLYPLLPERKGLYLGRYVIMISFRLYLASLSSSQRCSFDLSELDALRNDEPLIIAPNHPCLLDAVMIISRLPNIACVMKSELMNNVFLGAGARLARYIRNEPIRQMVMQATRDFKTGSHLLLFPEGTRTVQQPVNALKGSIALIAQKAKVPVQTVIIETDSPFLSKGWSLFRKPAMPISYRVRLGKRFSPPENTHRFMEELEQYFRDVLKQDTADMAVSENISTTIDTSNFKSPIQL
ncbi:lysophospholipid acyltransferase family protein [Methylophilus luteus]|uniref:Lysophospholipid acyltransferase family protein n=1 Tax=Methylophilus luteus TaxID=640108 RepID=A0ABW3F550_9PROT